MTATTIRVQMAQRKDTAANWTAANPILLSGEIGYETDTKKFKIGDGTTNWNNLAYLPIPDGSGNLTITGNLEIGTTGSLTFEGSTANGFETTLAVTDPTADRTITLPNVSGTVVTTGDTGSVTSTMIADGTIVNADISGSAEIAVSKLANGTANQVIVTDGTNVSWSDNLTLTGDLTVNGTTTTINTQELLVEDKNIIIGNVTSPTDVTADGGGITLKGATDKTINWVDSTDAWTSSERFSYPLGSATAPALTFTGDPNTGIYSPGADQVAISSNGVGRLFIDASGNVGVGRTPVYVFDTQSGAGNGIRYTNSANSIGNILGADSSTGQVGTTTSHPLSFLVGSVERMRLDTSGRLGLGTSSPGALLDLAGGAIRLNSTHGIYKANSDGFAYLSGGTSVADGGVVIPFGQSHATNANEIHFRNASNTTRMVVDSSGRVGIGTTSLSDTLTIAGSVSLNSRGNTFSYKLPDWRIYNSSSGNALVVDNYTTEALRIDSSNRLLVGTSSDSGGALLQVNGDRVRVATAKTPASASDTGITGEICWDANYVYVCTATNTWKRSAISTW